MTTASEMVRSALRTVGALPDGQPMTGEDGEKGLEKLNDLLDLWATETLYAYTTTEYVYTLSGATVTIGPTGNIQTDFVPVQVQDGFIRSGGIDYGFRVVSYQTYSDIAQKSLGGNYPSVAYYDGNGTLTFYPVPTTGELHLPILLRLSHFASLVTDYGLPAGYKSALQLSLAESLAPDYGRQLMPATIKAAAAARRTIKRANHKVPILGVPYRPEPANGNVLVTPPDADIYGGGSSSSL
jgi:hypothetical protein